MSKPILISGIQPTGKLHLGNYLGALKNFVELQNSGQYDCYFFIADLHSLTEDFNPAEKPQQILNLAADFLAAGLDPKKSTIFVQSQIPAHSELAWILNTITPIGELRRMTQFKDKINKEEVEKISSLANNPSDVGYLSLSKQTEKLDISNVGLFDYPVLMAADILLYNAQVVPVGDDQLQHLEFTRTLARKFNSKFGQTFIEPKAVLTEASRRIMSLDDATKKMSKSRTSGCLFLDDSPEIILKKIASAVTDSGKEVKYDIINKPAISNLLTIYSSITGKSIKNLEEKYVGKGYVDFKENLAKEIINFLKPFQEAKAKLKETKIKTAIKSGNKKAQKKAQLKIQEINKKIGLI